MIRTWLRKWLGIDQLAEHRAMMNLVHGLNDSIRRLENHGLLPQNFNVRLTGTENSLRIIERKLAALQALEDGTLSGLDAHKTADLLEAAAALRRDRSAADLRGMSLEDYQAEKAARKKPDAPDIPREVVERCP